MKPSIITIDGPSGVGKGTLASLLAQHLHWHLLESGAIYRVVALAARQEHVALDHESALVDLVKRIQIRFVSMEKHTQVLLNQQDVSQLICTETAGNDASKVAVWPELRQALLAYQRQMAQPPGLVADGRDMGTIIFPDAPLKFFLTASAEIRAERRYKQLREQQIDVNLSQLIVEIKERDARDSNRAVAPLVAAHDAILIDTSTLSKTELFAQTCNWIARRFTL